MPQNRSLFIRHYPDIRPKSHERSISVRQHWQKLMQYKVLGLFGFWFCGLFGVFLSSYSLIDFSVCNSDWRRIQRTLGWREVALTTQQADVAGWDVSTPRWESFPKFIRKHSRWERKTETEKHRLVEEWRIQQQSNAQAEWKAAF